MDVSDQSENTVLKTQMVAPLPLVDAATVCCYVSTSGSTGVPKGVIVDHRGMVNLCAPDLTDWRGQRRNAASGLIPVDLHISCDWIAIAMLAGHWCFRRSYVRSVPPGVWSVYYDPFGMFV